MLVMSGYGREHEQKGELMIFDALRQIASNWLPDLKPLVNAAKLLHVPVTPHQVLPKEQDLETISAASINFRLPYPVTAIEDNASCVLLIDPKPGLKGLDETRLFIDCLPLNNDEGHYNDTPIDRAMCELLKVTSVHGIHVICVGTISSPAQMAGQWLALGELLWMVTGTVTEQHTTIAGFNALPEQGKAAIRDGSLRNAMTAIEEIIMLRSQGMGTRQ
jgi:hypothetical protein